MLPLVEAAALVTSADQNITLPADGDKRQEFIDLNKPLQRREADRLFAECAG